MKINQLKLEVYDAYKEHDKVTTNIEAVNNEDVKNKPYLDRKLIKTRR